MMITGENWVIQLLVPETAVTVFVAAWLVSAVAQPVNSLAFATDGIHWGTGDYGYLRNAMILATAAGAVGLAILDLTAIDALSRVWWVTSLWIFVRGLLGMLRIWPGIGRSPLRSRL
jgi:MATE family multidrug resistance protein